MRKIAMALSATLMLFTLIGTSTVHAASPAEPAVTAPAPTVESAPVPAFLAPAAAPDTAPLLSTPKALPAAVIQCPAEPVKSCGDCIIGSFPGVHSTRTCYFTCINGAPRIVCGACGEGCF